MSVIPFSQALRERTWSGHSDSEGAGFMTDLMKGEGTREDYIALVAQHYFIYEAIEAAAEQFAADATAALPQPESSRGLDLGTCALASTRAVAVA